jgi:hypothetical protein
MKPDIKALEIECEIRQIKSMCDNTVNLTINIPEYCKEQASELLKHIGELAKVLIEFS